MGVKIDSRMRFLETRMATKLVTVPISVHSLSRGTRFPQKKLQCTFNRQSDKASKETALQYFATFNRWVKRIFIIANEPQATDKNNIYEHH